MSKQLHTAPDGFRVKLPPVYEIGETCPRCEDGTVVLVDFGDRLDLDDRFTIKCTNFDSSDPPRCGLAGLPQMGAKIITDDDETGSLGA